MTSAAALTMDYLLSQTTNDYNAPVFIINGNVGNDTLRGSSASDSLKGGAGQICSWGVQGVITRRT